MRLYAETNRGTPNHQVRELVYWRKFERLHDYIWAEYDPKEKDTNNVAIPVDRELLEKILYFVSHNRDYFDEFKTVVKVCEVLDDFDSAVNENWILMYRGDW